MLSRLVLLLSLLALCVCGAVGGLLVTPLEEAAPLAAELVDAGDGFVMAELEASRSFSFDSEPVYAQAELQGQAMLEAGTEAEMQGQSTLDMQMELQASLQAEVNAAAAALAASRAELAAQQGHHSQGIFDTILRSVKNVLQPGAPEAGSIDPTAMPPPGGMDAGAMAPGALEAAGAMPMEGAEMMGGMPGEMGMEGAMGGAGAGAMGGAAGHPQLEPVWGGNVQGQIGTQMFHAQPDGLQQQALPGIINRAHEGIEGAVNELSQTMPPPQPSVPAMPDVTPVTPPQDHLLNTPLPPLPPVVPVLPAPQYPQRIPIKPLPQMPPLINPRPEPVWSRVEREVERRRRAREARRRASQPLPLPQEHVHAGFKMPGRAPTPQELAMYSEQSRQLANQHKLHQRLYMMNHQLNAEKGQKAALEAQVQASQKVMAAQSMLESFSDAHGSNAARSLLGLAPGKSAPAPLAFRPGTSKKAQECSNEGRRRIRQCVALLGAWALPKQGRVNFDEERVLQACEDKTRSPHITAPADEQMCRSMRAHLLEVAELNQIEQALRSEDAHNACVKLLATPVNGQAWLSDADGVGCPAQGVQQNEGVTGARCLFFHGSGVAGLKYDDANTVRGAYDGLLPSFPSYWGGAEKQLGAQCDARFFVTDTLTRGWDSVALQEEFCAAIQTYRPHAIYAHSSANLVLAAAIANRVAGCDQIAKAGAALQSGQAQWVALNAMWDGTPLADSLQEACARVDAPKQPWYEGVCDRQHAAPYKAFAALSPSYVNKAAISLSRDESFGRAQFRCDAPQLVNHFAPTEPIRRDCVTMRSVAEQYVSGALCGLAPAGLQVRSEQRSAHTFLGDAALQVNWANDRSTRLSTLGISGHDGLTAWSSCRLHSRAFGTSSTSSFYASLSSVHDGRCSNGDNAADPAKQPCNWMSGRLSEVLAGFSRPAPGPAQSFVSGASVGGTPQQSPLSPDFTRFRYEYEAIEQRIKHQLADDDAANASYTPVKAEAAAAAAAAPKVRRPARDPALVAKRLEEAAERKRQADARAVSQANLEKYQAAQA